MTRDELREAAQRAIAALGGEGFPAAIVYHDKPRKGGQGGSHVHVVLGRVSHDGAVLPASFEKLRLETACRIMEHDLGEAPTLGPHHRNAVKHARAAGREDVAAWLVAAHGGEPEPPRGVGSKARARLDRAGQDLGDVREAVRAAWAASDSRASLESALAERGLALRAGERAGVVLVVAGEVEIGALDRLAKVKRAAVAARVGELKEGVDHDTRTRSDGPDRPGPGPGRGAPAAPVGSPPAGSGIGAVGAGPGPGVGGGRDEERRAEAAPAPGLAGRGGGGVPPGADPGDPGRDPRGAGGGERHQLRDAEQARRDGPGARDAQRQAQRGDRGAPGVDRAAPGPARGSLDRARASLERAAAAARNPVRARAAVRALAAAPAGAVAGFRGLHAAQREDAAALTRLAGETPPEATADRLRQAAQDARKRAVEAADAHAGVFARRQALGLSGSFLEALTPSGWRTRRERADLAQREPQAREEARRAREVAETMKRAVERAERSDRARLDAWLDDRAARRREIEARIEERDRQLAAARRDPALARAVDWREVERRRAEIEAAQRRMREAEEARRVRPAPRGLSR